MRDCERDQIVTGYYRGKVSLYGFWYCNVCRAQNHEMDGECQYCECQGKACKRDNCSDDKHFDPLEDKD
jgi:hypothetical protein